MDVITAINNHTPSASAVRNCGDCDGQSDSDNDEVTDFLDCNEPDMSTVGCALASPDQEVPLKQFNTYSNPTAEVIEADTSTSTTSQLQISSILNEEKLNATTDEDTTMTCLVPTKYSNCLEGTISDLQNLRKYLVKRKSTIYQEVTHRASHSPVLSGVMDVDNDQGVDNERHLPLGLQNSNNLSISLPDLSAPQRVAFRCRSLASSAAFVSNYGLANVINLMGGSGCCMPTWPPIYQQRQQHQQQLQQSRHQQQCLLNNLLINDDDRRKSWTGISQLTKTTVSDILNDANTNTTTNILMSNKKSLSLSSLDSVGPEEVANSCATNGTTIPANASNTNIRATEQRISTHSLNESELAMREFERIDRAISTSSKSNLPGQKSVSTSSIMAKEEAENQHLKTITRHLTDSEDENQSLLRTHRKIEVYDHVEKRRKRGSLFFRKKKDKGSAKLKGSHLASANGSTMVHHSLIVCDVCGNTMGVSLLREHQIDCKGRSGRLLSGLKRNNNNHDKYENIVGGTGGVGTGHDYYDGVDEQPYNDDQPLICAVEFLHDAPIEAGDLGAEPILGIELKEHDSWSPGVPKDILKSLKEQQIKRQEHIYEFIMTEKHHCQTLLVMQKVFVESLEKYFPNLNCTKMFPRLLELTELHTSFLKKLRLKQKENSVIDSIADILLDFFSAERSQNLRLAYGEFCANHRTALEQFKLCLAGDSAFGDWYKHCLTNPLLKKKGIPECILFVTQRLTKYPLLMEPLLKSARDNKLETEKLQKALALVKELLVDVDACVAEKELKDRQIDIYNRIDPKSFTIYKNKPFRKQDIGIESRRRLKFEGIAALMQGRSKTQVVLVVVLTDCLCFLLENSAHNKYTFFTPENKSGVVPLQKLLIREKAGTESRGIYIISSNPMYPEMYELKVQTPKDKNMWIQSIRQAVLDCPSSDLIEREDLTAEEKLRIGTNKREIIEKIRQKDIEQAILLEEKLILQMNLMQKDQKYFGSNYAAIEAETNTTNTNALNVGGGGSVGGMSASQFLAAYGSYRDLNIGPDCDTGELWRKVVGSVQEIGQLAASVYTAATGQPVARSVSSVGEKQSDTYASPMLPKRAETFAGFDEKRNNKNSINNNINPNAINHNQKMNMMMMNIFHSGSGMTPRLQELEEDKRDSAPSTVGNGGGKGTTSLIAGLLPGMTAHSTSFNAPILSGISNSNVTTEKAQVEDILATMPVSGTHNVNSADIISKDDNLILLQITHNLHTLLCIISQQMTAIHSLQLQLALYRDNTRTTYTHNDQLEELRNLQDKLQEEKMNWMRQKEQQDQELNEKKLALEQLQTQIKAEQNDIRQQREQLYRKMEILSSQGLLLSPNTPLMITSPSTMMFANQVTPNLISTPIPSAAVPPSANSATLACGSETNAERAGDGGAPEEQIDDTTILGMLQNSSNTSTSANNGNISMGGEFMPLMVTSPASPSNSNVNTDRRKDKWRTASTISKTPPVHLLSATNAPKIQTNAIKQQIPIKLSSLSSTSSNATGSNSTPVGSGGGGTLSSVGGAPSKNEKMAISNPQSNVNTNHSSTGLTQMFPLKLADKRHSTSGHHYSHQHHQQQQQQQQQPQHAVNVHHLRTGSSPAVIQQAPLSNAGIAGQVSGTGSRHATSNGSNGRTSLPATNSKKVVQKPEATEEEEIYF